MLMGRMRYARWVSDEKHGGIDAGGRKNARVVAGPCWEDWNSRHALLHRDRCRESVTAVLNFDEALRDRLAAAIAVEQALMHLKRSGFLEKVDDCVLVCAEAKR